jgi:hypothetical protein
MKANDLTFNQTGVEPEDLEYNMHKLRLRDDPTFKAIVIKGNKIFKEKLAAKKENFEKMNIKLKSEWELLQAKKKQEA